MSSSSGYNKNKLKKAPKKAARKGDALLYILGALCAISLSYAILTTLKQLSPQDYQQHMDHVLAHHSQSKVKHQKLSLEQKWAKGLKSCIPRIHEHCRHSAQADEHRVAIVAPRGDFSEWIFHWVQEVVSTNVGSKVHMHMDLVTHVPGVGIELPNHYSKVIRVIPSSLLLGAADALRGTLELGTSQQMLQLQDLKSSLRILVRYHCRITHMTTHIPVLSLEMESVATVPRIASRGLLDFLNITAHHHGEANDPDDAMEDLEDSDDVNGIHLVTEDDQELVDMSNTLKSYAASLLSWIQTHDHVMVRKELDKVLEDELTISDSFSECHSLWTTGDGPDGTHLTGFAKRLARSLAPACKKAKDYCTHPRDFCEEKGDVICKGVEAYPKFIEARSKKSQMKL